MANGPVTGWVLVVIGVLITGVWGASRWWHFGYHGPSWSGGAYCGVWTVSHRSLPDPEMPGWRFGTIMPWLAGWSWLTPASGSTDSAMFESLVDVNLGVVRYEKFNGQKIGGSMVNAVAVVLWPFALASLLGGGWILWAGHRLAGAG